jgi:hypothetical protein
MRSGTLVAGEARLGRGSEEKESEARDRKLKPFRPLRRRVLRPQRKEPPPQPEQAKPEQPERPEPEQPEPEQGEPEQPRPCILTSSGAPGACHTPVPGCHGRCQIENIEGQKKCLLTFWGAPRGESPPAPGRPGRCQVKHAECKNCLRCNVFQGAPGRIPARPVLGSPGLARCGIATAMDRRRTTRKANANANAKQKAATEGRAAAGSKPDTSRTHSRCVCSRSGVDMLPTHLHTN